MVTENSPQDDIRLKIESFMGEIYRIVAICLGIPSTT